MGESCSYLNVDELKPVHRERLKIAQREVEDTGEGKGR